MGGYESEIILFQLYLYARKKYPQLGFNPDSLKAVLREWGITKMRQLFDLPAEAKIALTLPLIKPGFAPAGKELVMTDQDTLIAA